MLRAFVEFWRPRGGIRAQMRIQARELEFAIVKAELDERRIYFHLQALRAQHAFLMEELESQGVDTIPPGGDNGPITPGQPAPPSLQDLPQCHDHPKPSGAFARKSTFPSPFTLAWPSSSTPPRKAESPTEPGPSSSSPVSIEPSAPRNPNL